MVIETIAARLIVFFIILWILMMILSIALLIFWIFMLVDVIKRKFKTENDKIVWILVVALTNWIGALIYYLIIKRKVNN